MIGGVMGYSWRCYELTVSLIQMYIFTYKILIDMCIYTDQYTHVYFLAVSIKRAWKHYQHPVAMWISMHISWFLLLFFKKRSQSFLEKCLILELGQELYKMNREHLPLSESQEMLNKKKTPTFMGLHQREIGLIGGPSGQNWNSLSNKIKQYWIITQSIRQVCMSSY